MNPLKTKTLYKQVAEELGVSEDMVEAVAEHYWKELRRVMSTGENFNILVPKFGTFTASRPKIADLMNKYKGFSKNLVPNTFAKKRILEDMTKKLTMLENVKAQADNNLKELILKKQLRNGRKSKTGLET